MNLFLSDMEKMMRFWSTLKQDECYPGGESPMQFFLRIKSWFEAFLAECKDVEWMEIREERIDFLY